MRRKKERIRDRLFAGEWREEETKKKKKRYFAADGGRGRRLSTGRYKFGVGSRDAVAEW